MNCARIKKTILYWLDNNSLAQIITSFLWLGLTAFGGPIAHIGYFRQEFVIRRKWCDEETYINIVALCNFLPGPASSQVGMLLGFMRSGMLGAIVAWCCFTLPSAIILIIFAIFYSDKTDGLDYEWIHGLKLVAVAVVAQAVIGMALNKIQELRNTLPIFFALFLCIFFPSKISQFIVLLCGAMYGATFLIGTTSNRSIKIPIKISKWLARVSAVIFAGLIIISLFIIQFSHNVMIKILADIFVVGASVFGGGHVVLPMLQQAIVANGIITNEKFLVGYGLAQAVPGPLFTFSAYLGSVIAQYPYNTIYGLLCLIAIFIPSFFLIFTIVPVWNAIQDNKRVQAAINGIQCVVIGILAAALYNPVYLTAVKSNRDNMLVAFMIVLLIYIKVPSFIIVLIGMMGGILMARL